MARDNLCEGPEASLPAAGTIDGSEETTIQRILLPGVSLPPGEYTFAISLHNPAKPSSDLRIAGITLVEIEAAPLPKKLRASGCHFRFASGSPTR